jgi:hypothetical protein
MPFLFFSLCLRPYTVQYRGQPPLDRPPSLVLAGIVRKKPRAPGSMALSPQCLVVVIVVVGGSGAKGLVLALHVSQPILAQGSAP